MAETWKKVCKVCNGDIDPKNLSAHGDCLQYAGIIRNVKV